jgi:tetratricopeptide (TPR) repeat protein
LDRIEEALEIFDFLSEKQPFSFRVLNNRGNALNLLGQSDAALKDFRRVVKYNR